MTRTRLNFVQSSSFVRQRRKLHDNNDTESLTETMKKDDHHKNIHHNVIRKHRRRSRRRRRTRKRWLGLHWSSYLLIFSILVWTYVQISCYSNTNSILNQLDNLSISGRNGGRSTSSIRRRVPKELVI